MGARQLSGVADARSRSRVRTIDRPWRRRRDGVRRPQRRVVLAGAPDDVRRLHAQLAATACGAVAIVGAVRPSPAPLRARHARDRGEGPRWLGAVRDLARLARVHDVGEVIVVPGVAGGARLLAAVLHAAADLPALRVAVVPSTYELRVGRIATRRLGDVPLIEVARAPSRRTSLRVKHLLDHVIATVLLVVVLPVVLGAALAVRLTSRGPVLFRQRRVGRDGREFVIYKLRTMRDDAERTTGPVLARRGDARVTRVGRCLRATRIDELPQLLNVLNGTMSLVGPRPERPEFADALARALPGYDERWLVKPGLTGLAQVRGEYHTSPEVKLRHDLAYVHNHALALDLRILAATVRTLAARRGV